MYCSQCGHELPTNATACPACGYSSVGTSPPPAAASSTNAPPPPSSGDTVDQILTETKKAAHELADASARLSKRLVARAQTAAKDPTGSAKKAAKRVAKELDAAAKEIDRILKSL